MQRDLGRLGSQNAGSMDLRCLSRWQGNPYHDLIDCLMPIVPALHLLDAVGGQACFSSNQMRWISVLAPRVRKNVKRCELYQRKTGTGDHHQKLHDLIDRNFDNFTAKWTRDEVSGSRTPIGPALPTQERSSLPPVIVLLTRASNRVLSPLSALSAGLSARGKVTAFSGHESAATTISLFRRANVVVGFHGAGFANAIFARNGTKLVELSTFADEAGTRLWRSNLAVLAMWGSYSQYVVRLPLVRLLEANYRRLSSTTSFNVSYCLEHHRWPPKHECLLKGCSAARAADLLIKAMPRIPLSADSVRSALCAVDSNESLTTQSHLNWTHCMVGEQRGALSQPMQASEQAVTRTTLMRIESALVVARGREEALTRRVAALELSVASLGRAAPSGQGI